MVLRKIALVLLYSLLAVASSIAQSRTLHVVTFIATEDDQIGPHLKKTQQNIDNWYADVKDYLSTYPDVTTKRWSFSGNKFHYSELVKFLKEFHPPTTDATLFWFVGHGVQDNVSSIKTPNVLVLPQRPKKEADRQAHSINLQDIFDALHHQTDFLWFVGDACNSPMEQRFSSGSKAAQGIKAQSLGMAKNQGTMASNYYDLFFNSKEQKLFYDIKKGRQTYTTKSHGALYSHAFLRLLDQEMQGAGIPNTDIFHNKVLKEYEDLLTAAAEAIAKSNKKKRKKKSKANTNNIKIDNPGLIKRIILTLFEGKANRKLRKRYKRVLENGNLEEVGNLLPQPSVNGQESAEYKQFLKDNPTAYYLSMGLFKEYNADNREDSAYVGECYCTANEVLNRGMSTSKEFVLLEKIDKYNAKNDDPLDIIKAGGRKKWLQKKCSEYKAYLGGEKKRNEDLIDSLQSERQQMQDDLDNLLTESILKQKEIEKTKEEILANEQVIKTTTEQWEGENYEISYSIPKIPLQNVDKACLERTVQKLSEGEPLTTDCERLYADYVKVERKLNNGRDVNARRRAVATGYTIGEYCDQRITDATELYLGPLLTSIQKVPTSPINYRNQLKVALQITGNADARPCRGAGCNYVGQETATYNYLDGDGNPQVFSTVEGKRDKISNEQLALARALCAQNQATAILNAEGVFDITYEFIAQVNDDKEGTSRGVSIAFELENQFLHYKEKVDDYTKINLQLEQDLKRQERELNQLIDRIVEAEEQINDITNEINETRRTVFEIEKEIQALSDGGLRQNLTDILLARGMTKAQAKEFLNN